MPFDPIAQALSALNKLAGNELVHRLGIYEPAQKFAYRATRGGFRAASTLGRQFKAASKLVKAERVAPTGSQSDLFDLSITEEQQMVQDMVRRFASDVMVPAAAAADEALGAPEDFRAHFAELGLYAFAVPEGLGGAASEGALMTQVLMIEELCRGDMGLAVSALAPIAVANALCRWGSAEQQARYLAPFAEDKPPLSALAVSEPRPAFDARELRTRARIDGDGFVLHGEKSLVPLVDEAEFYLVAADLVGRGPQLFLVEAAAAGLTLQPRPAMGLRAAGLGALRFDGVRLPADALLGGDVGVVDYTRFLDHCALAWSAAAVGTSQAVLDYVIPYVNERKAFGEPVSHRQSVAFMVANIGIELEGMRLLTYRAAARAERGMDFHREAYLAQLLAADKGMQIGTDGVQLLGGHGFTKEHPAERWYRDLRAVAIADGGLMV
ncbi:MAG: acyl-CoA dehydrogenase family protein [Myxococcales bacterium]|nr:acyl-CoA dehydrogenase family protein [Myxococcales bacterium]